MKFHVLTLSVATAVQFGCSTPTPQRAEHFQAALQSAMSSQAALIGAAGYQHTLERSKFALGSASTTKDEFGMHKIVGDQGVFATRSSGMVTAITNANSAARRGTPIGDNASHNAAVRQYFVGAGLPADQIDSVQDYEVVDAPASLEGAPTTRTVAYRYSMITRQIQGVPVPDSFAWARMNTDGTVVEEQVYWPPMTQDVISGALAFSASLADPVALAAFDGQLPTHDKFKGVMIRHSPGEWDQAFVADAYYDVVQRRASMSMILHADRTGNLIVPPYEAPGAWGPETGTLRKVH